MKTAKVPEMRANYDFSGRKGVRGKYAEAFARGYTVTINHPDGTQTVQEFSPKGNPVALDPDVLAYFPTAEAVNKALRGLIALVPEQPQKKKAAGGKK